MEEDLDASLPDTRLFITGLPPNFTSADLGKHFARRYQITDAQVIPGRRIGFVGFRNYTLAKNAVKYFDKTYIRMSKIGVAFARPIELERPSEGGQARPAARLNKRGSRDEERGEDQSKGKPFQPYVPLTKPGSGLKRKREEESQTDKNQGAKIELEKGAASEKVAEDEEPKKLSKDERKALKKAKRVAEAEQATEAEQAALAHSEPKKEKKKKHKGDHETSKEDKGGNNASQDATDREAPTDVDQPNVTSTNDDEWLRSKTSRVLDLVDKDEKFPAASPEEAQDTAESIDENLSETEDDSPDEDDTIADTKTVQPEVFSTKRLFVRNLPFSTEESELKGFFASSFPEKVQEVHLVKDQRTNQNKGFAYVTFTNVETAQQAAEEFDGKIVQGRILHVLPATEKTSNKLDDYELSKLPLKKQKLIKRKAEAGNLTVNWNSLYMNSDAVISSIASRLGVAKSQVLDPTASDAAVKQAQAETNVIQETKDYFIKLGVDFDSFQNKPRGGRSLLVKNLAYGTRIDDLKALFNACGEVLRVLLPPSGVLAIVEFAEMDQAQRAIKQLAYRNLKGSVLYLEKAPKDLFEAGGADNAERQKAQEKGDKVDVDGDAEIDASASYTLFVRNLNFTTSSAKLADTFRPLEGFLSAKVKTKTDPKRPGEVLSMGYGFVEFRTKQQAQVALRAMSGYRLDGHELLVKFSQQPTDAAEERRKEDNAKKNAAKRTKIIIKNLPFEATKKDIRSLFGGYGQLRSVRVPQKFDRSTRGFAFAEFVTAREAENAKDALKNTHLLGRRLVLDFATADLIDPEEEIRAMEKKVGQQAEKVELQKLAGPGRKKFVVGGARDEMDE